MKKHINKLFAFFISPKSEQIVDRVEYHFKILPHLPRKIKSILVAIAPWYAIVGALIGIVAGGLMSVLSLLSLLTIDLFIISTLLANTFLTVINAVLMFKAFKALRKKQYIGWLYLFWIIVTDLGISFLDYITGDQTFQAMIITSLIGFYLIFEIKGEFVRRREIRRVVSGGSGIPPRTTPTQMRATPSVAQRSRLTRPGVTQAARPVVQPRQSASRVGAPAPTPTAIPSRRIVK